MPKLFRDLSKKYPGLRKQSVSDFKRRVKDGCDVKELKNKKRGRKQLLSEEFMEKTIEIIKGLWLKGAPVSTAIINSVAKGIINANDRSLLDENGGYLSLNHQWGRNVLSFRERRKKDSENGNDS